MKALSTLTCWAVCAGLAAIACGGGEEAPAPGTPAAQQPAATATGEVAAPAEAAPAEAPAQVSAQETELLREVFSYQGSGRDPFQSLLRSGDVRPLFDDLRVTAINFDARYPGASVAVLRDTTVNRRYTVRVGDELGRLRVVEIQPEAVLMIIEEFGVERQMELRLRRRQEGMQ